MIKNRNQWNINHVFLIVEVIALLVLVVLAVYFIMHPADSPNTSEPQKNLSVWPYDEKNVSYCYSLNLNENATSVKVLVNFTSEFMEFMQNNMPNNSSESIILEKGSLHGRVANSTLNVTYDENRISNISVSLENKTRC